MKHPVGVWASRPVVAVEADSPALDALRMMKVERTSRLVVLENAQPVGILTERDVVFTANWVVSQPALKVRDVLIKPILTASAELTVSEAYQLFKEQNVRHMVVLGSRMEMFGVFTQTDLARVLKNKVFKNIPNVAVLMTRSVLSVTPEVTARFALALMASRAISGVVVIDGALPIGVFTEQDAVRLISDSCDLSAVTVGTVMTAPAITIHHTATPMQAIDLMRDQCVRRLVVINENGGLVGILTQTDLGRIFDHEGIDLVAGGGGTPEKLQSAENGIIFH